MAIYLWYSSKKIDDSKESHIFPFIFPNWKEINIDEIKTGLKTMNCS